jgi:hypothetical protein
LEAYIGIQAKIMLVTLSSLSAFPVSDDKPETEILRSVDGRLLRRDVILSTPSAFLVFEA